MKPETPNNGAPPNSAQRFPFDPLRGVESASCAPPTPMGRVGALRRWGATRTTLGFATVLLLSLVGSFAADKPQREEFWLRAAVQEIVPISSYAGTLMQVDVDPRFAVTIRVHSITPSLTNFITGANVTFAVHSPSLLFGTSDAKGKTYNLTLRRADGSTKFASLEVQR